MGRSVSPTDGTAWYHGITRYQWMVLVIASLGWVFDVFEGQIFVASMREAMPSLVSAAATEGAIALYNNIALGGFLAGGAAGGILFGIVSDRIGRKRTLSLTILFYSFFTCLSSLSQAWWHLAAFRFLVAMGVGGEWAVATALVAEVFPQRARAHVGGIFHASSVFGTWFAVVAGIAVIGNPTIQAYADRVGVPTLPWRLGFAAGVLPALLILWIRASVHEPESWQAARDRAQQQGGQKMGVIGDLFRGGLARRTFVGVTLATVGLATFWGTHIYGKNALLDAVEERYLEQEAQGEELSEAQCAEMLEQRRFGLKRWEMLGMFLVTTGGGIGLLCFGPISQRLGRRKTFLFYHLGGLASALILFQGIHGVTNVALFMPIFGFLTLGMHAGYAIYFPELYPTRLRGTGTGFCFNGARLLAAPVLFISGWMQRDWGFSLDGAASLLSFLFIFGTLVLLLAPETKGQALPE